MGRGKVRDIYDSVNTSSSLPRTASPLSMWCCHTDHEQRKVLTQMSAFWFDFKEFVPITSYRPKVDQYPKDLHRFRDQLEGRSMLVKKPECFQSNAWLEIPHGFRLEGYNRTARFAVSAACRLEGFRSPASTIFSPATKAETDHDENISERAGDKDRRSGKHTAFERAHAFIYNRAVEFGQSRIIICDTKFEFVRSMA